MRFIAVIFIGLALSACRGTSLRSPVAEPAKFQDPIVSTQPACQSKPVYVAPVPHIDSGDDPCPGGVCRVPGTDNCYYIPKEGCRPPTNPPFFETTLGGLSLLGVALLLIVGFSSLRTK